MRAQFPIIVAFGYLHRSKCTFFGKLTQRGIEAGNKCPWGETREAERQGSSRDLSEKPGHMEKVPCLNRACSRDEPGKAREIAKMLRSGKLDNSKRMRGKGPTEGRLPRAGKCLWYSLLALRSLTLLAEWNEPRKRRNHALTYLFVLIQNMTSPRMKSLSPPQYLFIVLCTQWS